MRSSSPKVLIADDDEAIIDAAVMILEVMGYSVDATLDGSAVPEIMHNSPDVVILDVWMAGVDGRDICKILRSDPSTKDVPVIMISANAEVKESVFASGANDFLEKPFDFELLAEKIEKLIA